MAAATSAGLQLGLLSDANIPFVGGLGGSGRLSSSSNVVPAVALKERRVSGQSASCSSSQLGEELTGTGAHRKSSRKASAKWLVSAKGLGGNFAGLVSGSDALPASSRNGPRSHRCYHAVVEEANAPVHSMDPTDDTQGGSFYTSESGSGSGSNNLFSVDNFSMTETPHILDSSNNYNFNIGGTHSAAEAVQLLAANQMGAQVLAAVQYQPQWVWFARSEEEERQVLDRVINGAIVGFVAAATLAKVFTIDHESWAGWTTFEIIRNVPGHNWSAYEAMLQTNPVFAKMCISGVVYSLGDWSAQYMEGKALLDFDRGRMMRSGLVGFCLHGSLSHYYYHFCEWLIPFKAWWVVPAKVAFDQTIWSGIWNSIYYTSLGLLRFEKPQAIWTELRSTFIPLLTAGWKLWPLAHIVTYGVMPVEQRLLWVDMVELVWVSILSMISNEKAEERRVEEEDKMLAAAGETAQSAALAVESAELETLSDIYWSPDSSEAGKGKEEDVAANVR
eukprot:jgi/Mesen1/383/ME000010S_10840